MCSRLVLYLVLLASSPEVHRHPPLHLPPPTALPPLPPPPPTPHTKVISVATCAVVSTWLINEAAEGQSFGATPAGAGNYLANRSGGGLTLYCDARLPAEATGFDYAELEYFAPNLPGNGAPSLLAYLDTEAPDVNGFAYSQTMPLGSCTGAMTPLYAGTNPVSTCSTQVAQSFSPEPGTLQGFWPWAVWTYFSVHFLILLPSSPDASQPDLAYRIVIHYESP